MNCLIFVLKFHFSGVLEAWCHCDFRKTEALKVNKFGRTYRTGTQAGQVIVVRSHYFLNLYENVQLGKRDIVTVVIYYYIAIEFHYEKDDFRLKCLLTFFPTHNTSIR